MAYDLTTTPFTIWLTGFSGSGKTTIGNALCEFFHSKGRAVYLIDGDVLRTGLCADLAFDVVARGENIRRCAEVAKILNKAGVICIAALISPMRLDRENACKIIGEEMFKEVHISTSLKTCEQRDVKGLYAKARNNEIDDFTGISSPYENPLTPVVSIDSSVLSVNESVRKIISAIFNQ